MNSLSPRNVEIWKAISEVEKNIETLKDIKSYF